MNMDDFVSIRHESLSHQRVFAMGITFAVINRAVADALQLSGHLQEQALGWISGDHRNMIQKDPSAGSFTFIECCETCDLSPQGITKQMRWFFKTFPDRKKNSQMFNDASKDTLHRLSLFYYAHKRGVRLPEYLGVEHSCKTLWRTQRLYDTTVAKDGDHVTVRDRKALMRGAARYLKGKDYARPPWTE